ncbi:hypothetical protein D3C81_1510520 [compost metagenome]
MASARSLNTTASCISACVPTTTCAWPEATSSSTLLRALPVTLPASQVTRTPSGSSQARRLSRCCSANSSVGAASATCLPRSTASMPASAATTVLPEPTSPCTRRSMGCARARSLRISSNTRCCAPVRRNGRESSRAFTSPSRPRSDGARCFCRAMRWRRRLRWWASNSSIARRCCAGCVPADSAAISAPAGGRCMVSMASRSEGSLRSASNAGGRSSSVAASGSRSSAWLINLRRLAGPTPSTAG